MAKKAAGSKNKPKDEEVTPTPKESEVPDNNKVHILSVKARNIKCIREAQISTEGAITEIRGDAGQGKSAWLAAIEAAVVGIDPDLVRQGEDSAEVILVTDRARIERAIRPGSQDLKVLDLNDIKMTNAHAKAFLKTISAPSVFDPIRWALLATGPQAGKTERLRQQRDMLLSAIPLKLEREDLRFNSEMQAAFKELGVNTDAANYFSEHALDTAQEFGRVTAMKRKGMNTHIAKKKHVAETAVKPEVEAPGFPVADCAEQAGIASDAYREASAKLGAQEGTEDRIKDLEQEVADFGDEVPERAELDSQFILMEDQRVNTEAEIARLQALLRETSEEVAALVELKGRRSQIEGLERSISSLGETIQTDLQEKVQGLRDEMESTSRGLEARQQMDIFLGAAKDLEKAEEAVEPLDALVKYFRDTLPEKLIARMDLPVDGMKIDDDTITIDGVPLHQLGTSQMITIAVRVAAKMNPGCGFLAIDGAESLGVEDRKVLAEVAMDEGLNMILTIVDADAEPSAGVIVMKGGEPKTDG